MIGRRSGRLVALAIALLVIGLGILAWQVSGRTAKTRAEAGWIGMRFDKPGPDERVRIGPDGHLDVAVYRPAGNPADVSAAVLLIHGNRRGGSDAALYRILARRLADRRAVVYSLSLPGFGGSAPIRGGEPVQAAQLLAASREGIEYLRAETASLRVPRILAGHSLGANLVLASCSEPDLVVEAIEPGRRIRERVVDPPHPELADFTEKLRNNVKGGVVDAEGVRKLYAALDPEQSGPPNQAKRCDVIDSQLLPAPERAAVERIGRARGAEIVWLENRDHDYGAISLRRGVLFPGRLIDLLADTILSRALESGKRNE